ncbi:MAG: acyltransferase [Bacteroidetes bacterium]|nr:acyltransferase [Bacteroidota bacterium]
MINNFIRQMNYIGLKNMVIYFIFQRILRINSHVPWPVHFSSVVIHPNKIKRNYWRPYLGYMPGCYIQAINGIEIGKNLRTGPGIKIISSNHDINNFDKHTTNKPIKIGDNCWIGANAIILPGVELRDHVIVGAGSVVTKSFPSNCVIGGVPAKIIKKIDDYSGNSNW